MVELNFVGNSWYYDLGKARAMPAKKTAKFETLPSGTLRVRLRLQGHKEVSETFPLFRDTAQDRRLQRIDAEEWAAKTRRELVIGTHVSTKEAEQLRLRDALCKYRDERLTGEISKESNARKDRNRIAQILADPIADRTIASLHTTDIAIYRDDLQDRAKVVHGKELKRTSISNKIQLITRALKHIGEKVQGVPDLTGVRMPAESPGRDRRVEADEMSALLKLAEQTNPLLPLIIKFATQTALRRERILEFRLSHIRPIGQGKMAIKFPKDAGIKRKRAGIVPITREIQALIDQAAVINASRNTDEMNSSQADIVFRINGNTLDYQWRKIILAADIKNLHFHDLRHEATSLLFERGLNTAEVMSITGHSTTEMVDRYSHYSAILVLEKLEETVSPESLASDFQLLLENFNERGGDIKQLRVLIENKFAMASVL